MLDYSESKRSDNYYKNTDLVRMLKKDGVALNPRYLELDFKDTIDQVKYAIPIKKSTKRYQNPAQHRYYNPTDITSSTHQSLISTKRPTPVRHNTNGNSPLVKSLSTSNISLPAVRLGMSVELKSNKSVIKLEKTLTTNEINESPSVSEYEQRSNSNTRASSKKDTNTNHREVLPAIIFKNTNSNQLRNFFSVKPLGKQRRIRNLSDMYNNLKHYPSNDASRMSSMVQEHEYSHDGTSQLDVSKNSIHISRFQPTQILEALNEESPVSECFKISKVNSQSPKTEEDAIIPTNNVYKQMALLKKPTLSQIRSEVRRSIQSFASHKKELELSPILKLRK